jgi:thiamine biosynthesis lipoprotein ApbE
MMILIGNCRCVVASDAVRDFRFYHENVLGTSLELHVRATDHAAARDAESDVLAEIDRLGTLFSSYDPSSDFSRWVATRDVNVKLPAELIELLAACDQWLELGRGAFDPRVEVFSRLWSDCARQKRVPRADELSTAKATLAGTAWRVDRSNGTARRVSACPLSLNGIAKGYIVERACDRAYQPARGILGLMLNIGGDLRLRGEIDETIGIASPWADAESAPPIAVIAPANRSVATSGASQRGFEINGRWYSHVIDPRSGQPVDRVAAVTVIALRSVEADVLAKVFSVLEPAESLCLARTIPGVECLIITREGEQLRSAGFREFETVSPLFADSAGDGQARAQAKPAGPAGTAKPGSSTSWSADHELLVNFEINQPSGGRRYRRPYIAIWVEDPDGKMVRTLSLWVSMGGAGPFQWLPDLKRWYKADQARKLVDKKDLFFTISRPTRAPGKYKVSWDGKDDHGNPRAAGDYTVFIEAAREHGTYQMIRQKITIGDKPFSEDLKGNVEIKSARIGYQKKPAPK